LGTYVGVSSGAELLDAAGRAEVLDAVAEGSFVHEGGTTTARLLTTLGLHRTSNSAVQRNQGIVRNDDHIASNILSGFITHIG
jgi:hypothetical protein